MPKFLSKLLSMGSNKQIKEYQGIVDQINELEPTYKAMSDEELKGQTAKFRERLEQGESLDDLLPEAFATVREASVRTTGLRHFDVQLMGGIALHRGTIAEMKTGEGKTLVSTLAGYLNALPGKGVHVVTVNDYLAKRDSIWMGQIYRFLGLKVGLIQNGMKLAKKKPAYEADITYGTNSEFGFDYLRDNMVTRASMRVQRGHNYAIVDEVDSILIDEARTPLIISGAGTKSANTYRDFARAVRGLVADIDYELDEAKRTIAATDQGLQKIESRLGVDIYSDTSGRLVNHLQQALKAEYMFHRDQQYVVVDGEVKIVDEFTGRIMEGRRYSEGLHQAIEAKEGVTVREENQTLATITLQNYFRLYDKLAGMTGTAMTEDAEFREIYNLPVEVIPPNKPSRREDHDDKVYVDVEHKFEAVVNDIEERHAKGQPVLVGTVSIENSERLSHMLDKRGIKHSVLNAKYHEYEAQIVAQAGRKGAVTIATNMAGRGTDILLGGNPDFLAADTLRARGIDVDKIEQEGDEQQLKKLASLREQALEAAKKQCKIEQAEVIAAGGLCVIGTERHESRRIDNQLRGRSGRQGDPGETQFYLSLGDDLMRRFGGDRMDKIRDMMQRNGMPADEPIQARIVSKAVESAQRKIEEINFAMRKNVLEYDDVMNKQRQVIYEERNKILDGKDLTAHVNEVTLDTVERNVKTYCSPDVDASDWDIKGLQKWAYGLTGKKEGLDELTQDDDFDDIVDVVNKFVTSCYEEKTAQLGDQIMHQLSTQVMLRVIDTRWMAYLQEMDYLKTGIGLRGYGQRDPLVEYKSEAYTAFTELVNVMYEDFLRVILRLEVKVNRPQPENEEEPEELRGARYSGPSDGGDAGATVRPIGTVADRVAPMQSTGQNATAAQPMNRKARRHPNAASNNANPRTHGSGKKPKKH